MSQTREFAHAMDLAACQAMVDAACRQRDKAGAARDHWIRLFDRLQAAVMHHKNGKTDFMVDERDEALYAALDKILRDAANA